MGHTNLNNAFMPRVIFMVEKFIIVLMRPHAWTIRSRQWHVIRKGHTVEKEIREGD